MKPNKYPLYVFHTESIFLRGGEKYLYEILKRIAKTHKVYLYLHAVSPKWKSRYRKSGVTVRVLWRPRHLYWLCIPITILTNYISLRGIIQNNDVIMATNFPMNFLATALSHNTICHCAEPLPIFYDQIRIQSLPLFSKVCVKISKFVYAFWDSKSYRKCSILTTLNSSVEKHVIAIHGRKPDLFLANGVDECLFSPSKKSHGRSSNQFIIGHSTDYTVFKGTYDFLAAINQLRIGGIHFHAYISESITDPVVKHKYLLYITQHGLTGVVSFVGTLSENNLVNFYRSLDVFVFTGSPEGSGASAASLSVLEAQACGIPVVRSVGENCEIINNKTGYYTNPHDSKTTSSMIQKILSKTHQQRVKMGSLARSHAITHYSWNKTASTLEELVFILNSKTYS